MGVGESVGIGVGVGAQVILLCANAKGAAKAAASIMPTKTVKARVLRMGNQKCSTNYTP